MISSANFTAVSARSDGSRGSSAASMRCTAQERFTAVGRALAIVSAALISFAFSGCSCAAKATPQAPVTPISGAPRTRIVEIASTQSRQSLSTRFSTR